MRTNLFKSLLVATMAIGAWGGVNSAFAQVTSFPVSANFDDGTKGIFSAGEIKNNSNIGNVLATGEGLPITLDFDGDVDTDGNQPYTLKENENLTFSYTAYQGWYSVRTKTIASTMELKNSDGVVLVGYTYDNGGCKITNVVINGKAIDGFSAFHAQSSNPKTNNYSADGFEIGNKKKPFVTGEDYNPIITFSISQSGFVEITFNVREAKLGKKYSKTFSGQLADDVKKDISTLGFTSNVDNSNRYYAIDNFSIKSEIKAVLPANYTIKYVDESSNELKTVTRSSTVGSNVTATADDMKTFYSSDKSEKYVYKSGNNEIKLAEDEASNVITLTFSKYTKFGYTINAKENGTDLGEVAKGETYSDGADIAISKFYKINNEWYETTTSPYYINIKPENKAATIEVKKSDITYFAETEKLGNNIGASYNKNMSNGAYSAIAGGKTAELCELPAGEYKVTIYLYERGDRGAYIRDLNNTDNNTNTLCYANIKNNSSYNLKEHSVTLKLYKTTKIGLSGWTTHNKNNDTYSTNQSAGLDYIYIQRTGDATETVSVSDAGYATYATTNNVVVPSDKNVKVMTVKVNAEGTAIELNEVKAGTVIPGNTGFLVKAAAGKHDFVVTSEAGKELENNNLVAATADVPSDGAKYFALTKIGDKVGFALVEKDVVIPAGKAYLEVTKGTAAAKFFGLDGEATGINSVKTAKADGAYYTLEGVKTTKPVKGLYIHNGKKIVVK